MVNWQKLLFFNKKLNFYIEYQKKRLVKPIICQNLRSFASSFIKLKIRLLDYFYIMSFWRHKLFFFNDSISSYKMSFVSLKSVISDIEFNDHLPSTISVFITSKARQNFISWLYSTTNMFVNSKARQKSNDALLLLQGCLSN